MKFDDGDDNDELGCPDVDLTGWIVLALDLHGEIQIARA